MKRFEQIRAINAQLQPYIRAQSEQVLRDIQTFRNRTEWDDAVSRRDYAFCLYPQETLRNFFTGQTA